MYAEAVTEKLYYGDPSMLEFDARVTDVAMHDGRCEVILDRTCFYPGGGGQPCDLGILGGAKVVEVGYREEEIVHVVDQAIAPGDVHGSVDARRRRDFMEQHTGQHIFSQALVTAGSLETVSVHFGDEDTTIELKADVVDERVLRAAEDVANTIVKENRRVLLHEVDRSEVSRFPLRRTPPEAGRLRIVEVEGFDWAACGGVHVASTGAVFLIKAVSQEKIRGRVRVHVMMGKRALEDYNRKIALAQGLGRTLTCGESFIMSRVEELVKNERDSARELRRLRLVQAVSDADDSAAAARDLAGALCVRRVFDAAGDDYLKAFVDRVLATPGRVVIAIDRGAEGFHWVVAHSLGVQLELPGLLSGLMGVAEAKGGGRGARMQGVGGKSEAIPAFADAIEGALARGLG
jgi:alanyl-tRNA synthetase